MDKPIPLTMQQMKEIKVGEAVTLTTVFLVFTIAILAVVTYKLFFSKGASITLPGGYKFQWTGAS